MLPKMGGSSAHLGHKQDVEFSEILNSTFCLLTYVSSLVIDDSDITLNSYNRPLLTSPERRGTGYLK